jgi:hypothetical protein
LIKETEENLDRFARSLSMVMSDFFDPNYKFKPRTALPAVIKGSNSMVSDMIKSLTKEKISLPIYYNEPLSMLQRQCEQFQYSYLLSQASSLSDQYLRLAHIAGFIVSSISLNINRILKPFNPILGETFEFIDNQLKYRFFAEQVSHNPPISAYIAESEEFVVYGDTRCKNKFKLLKGALELTFNSKTNLLFKNLNENYTYNKPTVYLKGLIMGSIRYDFTEIVTIENQENKNIKATIDFFEEGRKSKPLGYFEGKILDGNKTVYLIKGNWNSNLYITDPDGNNKQEIWTIKNDPFITNKDTINNYLISEYACNLNYLPESGDLKSCLPPTDSRLRPDQKALELRNLDLATSEKVRIENMQRARHRMFEEEKIKYEPCYFSLILNEKNNDYYYIYKGDYWHDRRIHNFDKLYKIFS